MKFSSGAACKDMETPKNRLAAPVASPVASADLLLTDNGLYSSFEQ
jgi:hypothetical protein